MNGAELALCAELALVGSHQCDHLSLRVYQEVRESPSLSNKVGKWNVMEWLRCSRSWLASTSNDVYGILRELLFLHAYPTTQTNDYRLSPPIYLYPSYGSRLHLGLLV
jgi:hypothetical protein